MDTLERNQVKLILEFLTSETLRATGNAQKAMQAEHSAKGTLRSGDTVKRAVEIVEDHATSYVVSAVDQVSAVVQDSEAFNVIATWLTSMFRGFDPHIANAIRLATAGAEGKNDSVTVAGNKLFAEARNRVFKQLEIHRFSFMKPSKGDLAASGIGVEAPTAIGSPVAEKRNTGGKPLAAHWDAMWAAIAVKLWSGELQPKSQADVKKAMLEWFNAAEIDIGDTAVTQRARQLWQAMQDADG